MGLRRAGSSYGLRRAGSNGGLRLLARGPELGAASLVSALASFMTFTRGAGSWSYQSAALADGSGLVKGTSQNTPRFDYDPQSGRRLLLIEPARTNDLHYSDFVDTTANDGLPDNWVAAGTADTDFGCVAATAPHGGESLRINDTAVSSRGCNAASSLAATTAYWHSIFMKGVGMLGTDEFYAFQTNAAAWATFMSAVGTFGWTRVLTGASTVAAGGSHYMRSVADPVGVASFAAPQAEAGDCATSWIPTPGGAAVARAAELCAIDPAVVGRLSGDVQFRWRPDFASTQALTVDPCLHAWAPGYELVYDPADDKLKVVVAGTKRAESAALTFARQTPMTVRVRYGASGQQLTVDGVSTSNPTSWGDPGILAPYLGSRAASVNCRPAGYGDYISAEG